MAKKNGKKASPSAKKNETTEAKGVLFLALSVITLLSLISFSMHSVPTKNWLGAAGHTIGFSLTAIFGLGSALISLFLGWIGWRLVFRKPVNHTAVKTLSVLIGVISICFLISVVEDQFPAAATWMYATFYKAAWAKNIHYHPGGAPAYYLYHDLQGFNLKYLLNALGVAILFTCTLLASLLFLAKINPFLLFQKVFYFVQSINWKLPSLPKMSWPEYPAKASPQILAKQDPEPKFETNSDDGKNESDFLRYVKLRIPSLQGQNSASGPEASSAPADMLAIQPESNLKARPSLSRKEQTEPEEPVMALPPPPAPVQQIPLPKSDQHEATPVVAPKQKVLEKPTLEAVQKQRREAAIAAQRVHNGDFSTYKLPPLTLLTTAKKLDHSSLKKDLKRKAEVLEETLQSFGIEAKVGQINCGPTITSFEVHPAIGVKVQKIKTLENDIALNMEAKSIRIIAPIPGKAVVGIEVPNAQAEEVGFKEMLSAYQQGEKKFHIPVLLGKAVNGDYVMSDLTKMPHCIIAGATGSGKSVCINTIVMSILINAKPDQIKLIMVDPKKVELTPYTRLPHMLAPVITEPQGACAALNWLVKEMEKRYDILKQIGVRNIEAFNNRPIDKDFEASLDLEIPEKLPYIVGIIDELADLMMVSSSDIETPIARIAQMARAVGIHLILATQRPSREVITGLIKANFPTRISFKVSSRINSQIVLDDTGAESLLGNGDMLFLPPGASHLVRAQGAYIRDEDINSTIKHICDQAPPSYVIESFDRMGQMDISDLDSQEDVGDALYSQAMEVVVGTGNASTTFLQRKLKIGYARAASLMDMMEQRGIIGSADGSKARKVLVGRPGGKDEDSGNDLLSDEMD